MTTINTANASIEGETSISYDEQIIDSALTEAKAAGVTLRGNALMAVVSWGACRGLNKFADAVFDESQLQVPEALEHDWERWPEGPLSASGKAPVNSPDHRATPAYPVAEISYEGVYAMSQHEGEMVYNRDGHEIHWVAENYTKPGSKKHYLIDPLKDLLPYLEGFVATEINYALKTFLV